MEDKLDGSVNHECRTLGSRLPVVANSWNDEASAAEDEGADVVRKGKPAYQTDGLQCQVGTEILDGSTMDSTVLTI